jgi:predicted nucleic acid-binding protein
MIERAFIDTNVFIYAFEKTKSQKKLKAVELIKNKTIHFSTSIQVLNEFVSATVKKDLLPKEEAVKTALLIENDFEIFPLDRHVFIKGMEIFKDKKNHVSLWDSLIMASAILNECDILYSEDMQHNFVIENVTIKNPFLEEIEEQEDNEQSEIKNGAND